MRCLGCEYPLSATRGSVCPECGRRFNPANPRTYLREGEPRVRWFYLVAFVLIELVIASPMVFFLLKGLRQMLGPYFN